MFFRVKASNLLLSPSPRHRIRSWPFDVPPARVYSPRMRTHLRLWLAAVVLLLVPVASVPHAQGAQTGTPARPNVLFIVIDDQNDWVGPLSGHPQVRTPNLDRLATEGTTFTNAHVQSPICNPSRTSFLTGLRPS